MKDRGKGDDGYHLGVAVAAPDDEVKSRVEETEPTVARKAPKLAKSEGKKKKDKKKTSKTAKVEHHSSSCS